MTKPIFRRIPPPDGLMYGHYKDVYQLHHDDERLATIGAEPIIVFDDTTPIAHGARWNGECSATIYATPSVKWDDARQRFV